MTRTATRAFTLIEILIIIGVIGLFASMILVAMGTARQQSRDSQRQTNLKQISTAMELDFQENSQYLGTSGGINVVPAIGTYLPVVPKDPMDLSPYQYTWANNTASRRQYCVYTRLERTADGYVCASEKGVLTKVYISGAPVLGACCY